MTINHSKNKKYHILISLFCLCYALGAQEVKATSDKGTNLQDNANQGVVTYRDDSGNPYNINSFGNISVVKENKDIKEEEKNNNIGLFLGKTALDIQASSSSNPSQYLFITHKNFPKNKKNGDHTQVIGLPLKAPVSQSDVFSIEARNTSLGSISLIVKIGENLNFYYRYNLLGWFEPEFRQVEKIDKALLYKKPVDDDSFQLLENQYNEYTSKNELVDWGIVKKADITNELQNSSKGWLYTTLTLDAQQNQYIRKFHWLNISTLATALLFISYCIFHYNPINKKIKELIHRYIIQKK